MMLPSMTVWGALEVVLVGEVVEANAFWLGLKAYSLTSRSPGAGLPYTPLYLLGIWSDF